MEMNALGIIPWFTYVTNDAGKGKAFYEKLFGWETTAGDHPMFSAGGQHFADVAQMNESVPSHWAIYVVVDDVAKTLARAIEKGGKALYEPMTYPSLGTMALLQDPWGGSIWLFKPETSAASAMGSSFGRACWTELMVADPEKAVDFYGDLFRWTFEERPGGTLAISADKNQLGHFLKIPPHAEGMPATWFVYFKTDRLQETMKEAEKLGARILMPKTEVPGMGSFAFLLDPTKARFYLWEPK